MGFDLAGKAAVKRVSRTPAMIVTARIKSEGTTLAHHSLAGVKKRRCYYSVDLLGLSKVPVRLTTGETIVITLVFLLIWFAGYMTGAEVTLIWEKNRVIYDCIFLPAPENSSLV